MLLMIHFRVTLCLLRYIVYFSIRMSVHVFLSLLNVLDKEGDKNARFAEHFIAFSRRVY